MLDLASLFDDAVCVMAGYSDRLAVERLPAAVLRDPQPPAIHQPAASRVGASWPAGDQTERRD